MHHMFVKLQADTHKLLSCLSGEICMFICFSGCFGEFSDFPLSVACIIYFESRVFKKNSYQTNLAPYPVSLTHSSLIL